MEIIKTNGKPWFSLIIYDSAQSSSRLARPVGVASVAPDVQTHAPACPSSLYYHSMHHATNLRVHSASQIANKSHVKKSIPKTIIKKKQNYIHRVSVVA